MSSRLTDAKLHGCQACLDGRRSTCTGKCRAPDCKKLCELGPQPCCDYRDHESKFCDCTNHRRSPMHPYGDLG